METYGFTEADWSAAKLEVKEILAARAKLRGMIPLFRSCRQAENNSP